MMPAYLALSAAFAIALAVRLAWPKISQRLGRVRPEDRAAIDLFLINRDETALTVKKEICAGGPEGWLASANPYGLPYRGRFYHVLAKDNDEMRYRHELAATGERAQGDLTLFQQNAEGHWTKVLQ